MLKARFSLLLLVGALIGLFGQGMAYAAGPAYASKLAAAEVGTAADCNGMPAGQPAAKHPCKGLTLACIAQMGCVIPITLEEALPGIQLQPMRPLKVELPVLPSLAGLEVEPESEPPIA